MACDLSALSNPDAADPQALIDSLQQCSVDPQLWIWSIVFTVVGIAGGWVIGRWKKTVVRDVILGAALGPLGWIVSLCLPAPKPPRACPACKRTVDRNDVHCRHCGAKLGG